MELPLAKDKHSAPYTRRVRFVQLGPDTITYAPKFNIFTRPTAVHSATSITIYKSMAGAQVFPGILTQKGFKEHCANFMGKDILHQPSEPKKTMQKTDMYWQEQVQEVQMGWAPVNTTKLHNALRKSGKNGTFVHDMQRKREGRYAEIQTP